MDNTNDRQGSVASRREFLVVPAKSMAGSALLGAIGSFTSGAADGASVKLERSGDDVRLVSGQTAVCRIPAVATPGAGKPAAAQFTEARADRITRMFENGNWQVTDQIRAVVPELYEWRRTWKNVSSAAVPADLCMDLETGYAPEYTLIPGISYGGNPEFGRRAPKGLTNADGAPWIFSAFRSSVPAGNYSEGAGWSVFCFVAGKAPSLNCGLSLVPRENRLVHRLMWPERDNLPSRGPAPSESLEIPAWASFEAMAYFVVRPAAEKRRAWGEGLDHVWRTNRHAIKPSFPPKRLWELGIQFAKETLWYDKQDFTGFSIGVNYIEGKWVQRDQVRFEIGWCGQNAAFGAALLQDYLWNKNAESLEKGERALDFWAQNGRLRNGLFYTHFDAKLGAERWGPFNQTFLGRPAKPGEKWVDTCNLGHGAYQYLLASELAEKCGRPKPLWRQFGLDMCDFFVRNALPDGTFGKAWSLEGECLLQGVSTGAHILWPMLKAYRMTRDRRYLETARRGYRAYFDRDLVNRGFCAGGAIDADTIDKESGLPLLFAALELYDLTGDKRYLREAERAGYYMATWQWHYSVPYHPESPLIQLGYDHFGGTSITVMAQGQDPWGELITMGWLRLAAATNNNIWHDRAVQCFNQGTLGVTDGSKPIKGVRRPVGSQNEGYFFSIRTPDGKRLWGDHNAWLVAWPSAHRLITLMHWPRWRDFEV